MAATANSHPPQNVGARLRAEELERRDNPAAYYYSPLGADHLSTNPQNYLLDSPIGVRGTPSTPAPGPNDHIYLRAATSGNADLIVPVGQTTVAPPPDGAPPTPVPGNTYAGLHEIDGYTGTVQLQKSLAVGTLELASAGKIWQNDPTILGYAGDLWVTNTFTWTAGTLNSGSVGGGVNLAPGATGTVAPSYSIPGVNQTVTLGSALTLLGDEVQQLGSTLTVYAGTYTVNNYGAGITALAYSTLLLLPGDKPADPGQPPPPPVPIKTITVDKKDLAPTAKGVIDIKPKSNAIVDRPPNSPEGTAVLELKGEEAKFTNNGNTQIKQNTEVRFTDLADFSYSYYQNDKDAVTELSAGSSSTVNKKCFVKIDKGVFKVNPVVVNGQPLVAKIDVAYPNNTALYIGKDATLQLNGSTDVRLEVAGGELSIHGTLAVAINPRGEEASRITATAVFFHEQATNPGQYKSKLDVTERSTGNGTRRDVGAEWLIADTSTSVFGSPDMTETSTDYTMTTTPITAKQGFVKRVH